MFYLEKNIKPNSKSWIESVLTIFRSNPLDYLNQHDSDVGTVVVGGFLPEKEATAVEPGEQHSSSDVFPNFPFEQGKHRRMSILLIC
jgi:hypothetical protein